MPRKCYFIAIVGLSSCLAGLGKGERAHAEEALKPSAEPVRVGLVGTLFRDVPAPVVKTIMRPFKSLMESQTGISGELVPGIPPLELADYLKDEKVQLGVFHGFEFAWARQRHPGLKPLMLAINKNRHLRAFIVVREDATSASLPDLQGKTFAVASRTREHCHLYLTRRCESQGTSVDKYFGKVIRMDTAERALDAVVNGQVDGTLVDDAFLEWYKERKPTRHARLKIAEQSEVFPAAVVAYYGEGLGEANRRRFREGMISAKDNPRGQRLMTLCQITAFEAIPPEYDQMLLDIAKAYPQQVPTMGSAMME